MRPAARLTAALVAVGVAGCLGAGAKPRSTEPLAASDPAGKNPAPSRTPVDPHPGTESLDLVRFELHAGERSPACWAELAPETELETSAHWSIDGDPDEVEDASTATLEGKGWTRFSRSPDGFGLERRAEFDSVDATAETTWRCRCEGEPETTPVPIRVRIRWTRGSVPEVSAESPSSALLPAVAGGSLVHYDFATRPGDGDPACVVHAEVALLVTPGLP